MSNGVVQDSDDDENEESEEEEDVALEQELESYILFTIAVVAFGMSPQNSKWVADNALIDTGTNIISSVGLPLLSAVRAANMRNIEPKIGSNQKHLNVTGRSVRASVTVTFYFHFGGRDYSVMLNILPKATPFIISRRDLDSVRLNYQTFYRVIERPDDGHSEEAEMQNYLPFLVFPEYSILASAQRRTIHRNLGHPSVENQMQVIE